ncbi:BRCT domain-containing protein [Methylocystis hirsuta]|uniref:NAD-dependent DNA ligase n=1 Tax=Methylocystis hirsuta TaxID=369798 RepID=A0A3M9XJT7_9HYPH|nr:BRCT domain-containing protein [Methylocystis hirsuta]RNJ48467.1 NAD-dependent DNA ligase [Methylocystis hirsuta]
MHDDHRNYYRFTSKHRVQKAINSLVGIIDGISIDAEINDREIAFLELWLNENREIASAHPFNELMPILRDTVVEGAISDDKKQDIIWLCENLRSPDFVYGTAADMQRLQSLLGGIASDGKISKQELEGLSTWLAEHEGLATLWPYDETVSLVTNVLEDGKISIREHELLMSFFSEFTAILDDRTIRNPAISVDQLIMGVCAVEPAILFQGSEFCFTGASERYTRSIFSELIEERGGFVVDDISNYLTYLVVGAKGNPCWMYACYGRKIEKAVKLRKQGARLLIVHENDLHNAMIDAC